MTALTNNIAIHAPYETPSAFTSGEYYVFDPKKNTRTSTINRDHSFLNKKIFASLKEYRLLSDNWDDDDSKAPSQDAITNADSTARLLSSHGWNIYYVSPGPNGEILLELRSENTDRSIQIIYRNSKAIVLSLPEKGKITQSEYRDSNLPELLNWLEAI